MPDPFRPAVRCDRDASRSARTGVVRPHRQPLLNWPWRRSMVSFTYRPGEYARALRRVQARRLSLVRDTIVATLLLAVGSYFWVSTGFSLWVGLLCGSAAALLVLLAAAVLLMPFLAERSNPKLR